MSKNIDAVIELLDRIKGSIGGEERCLIENDVIRLVLEMHDKNVFRALSEIDSVTESGRVDEIPEELLTNLISSLNEKKKIVVTSGSWLHVDERIWVKKKAERLFDSVYITLLAKNYYLCSLYEICLDDYNGEQIRQYRANCPEYKNLTDDPDVFSVCAITRSLSSDKAKDKVAAHGEDGLRIWLGKLGIEENGK